MLRPLIAAVFLCIPIVALACDRSAAMTVQSNLRGLATITERNDRVRYAWHPFWDNENNDRRLRILYAAADADACLTGRARELRFYSNGRLVGIATPNGGVRLVR